MRCLTCLTVALLALAAPAAAAVLTFNTNPLAGLPVLQQPGRQIVAGEPSFLFNPATDQIALNLNAFGVGPLSFANSLSSGLPQTGPNFIVLQNGAPLAAGTAANAIADRMTEFDPGFFIYFNSGLNLPRLVFSTDLSDPAADLAILARFTNLTGPSGFASLPSITEENVSGIPEPGSVLLAATGLMVVTIGTWRRRRA